MLKYVSQSKRVSKVSSKSRREYLNYMADAYVKVSTRSTTDVNVIKGSPLPTSQEKKRNSKR